MNHQCSTVKNIEDLVTIINYRCINCNKKFVETYIRGVKIEADYKNKITLTHPDCTHKINCALCGWVECPNCKTDSIIINKRGPISI